jgi:hypothetical protein
MSGGNAYVGPHFVDLTYGQDNNVGGRQRKKRDDEEQKRKDDERKQREEEDKKQQERDRFKLSDAQFLPPAEGLDFGDTCEVQVCFSPSDYKTKQTIQFKLYSEYNGRYDHKISKIVTSNSGTATSKFELPRNPDFDKDEKKSKDAKAKYVFSAEGNGKKVESAPLEIPTKGTKQKFIFQNIISSPRPISITGLNGKEVCVATVPSYASQNVKTISISDNRPIEFFYAKLQGDPFRISIKNGCGDHEIPLTIQDAFFQDNESIHILHSSFDTGGFMYGEASQRVSPIQFAPGFVEEDPLTFMEVGSRANEGGFKEGENTVDGLTEKGREILYEAVHGNDFAPAVADVAAKWKLLRDFFLLGKFYYKTTKGKHYVIFKGYAGLRKYYKGSRYLLENAKVVHLAAAHSVGAAVKEGLKWTKGTTITLVFIGSLDILEWMQQDEGQRCLSDILVKLAFDTAQVFLEILVGAIAAAGLVALLTLLSVSVLSGTLIIGAGIAVSIAVGIGITFLDNHFHLVEKTQEAARYATQKTKSTYEDLVVKPMCQWFYRLENEIMGLYGVSLPR